jgi:hypothetical protein
MKVYIGNYNSFISISELLLKLNIPESLVDKIVDYIPSFVYRLLEPRDRVVNVQISNSDTWSLDATLAEVIAPALVLFKKNCHGYPDVDLEDVPLYLQCKPLYRRYWTYYKGQLHIREFKVLQEPIEDIGFKRWMYILDEMIYAFKSKLYDWEDKYHSGELISEFIPLENGYTEWKESPKSTHKFDREGWLKESERIQNGFRLFGKYYNSLWN